MQNRSLIALTSPAVWWDTFTVVVCVCISIAIPSTLLPLEFLLTLLMAESILVGMNIFMLVMPKFVAEQECSFLNDHVETIFPERLRQKFDPHWETRSTFILGFRRVALVAGPKAKDKDIDGIFPA